MADPGVVVYKKEKRLDAFKFSAALVVSVFLISSILVPATSFAASSASPVNLSNDSYQAHNPVITNSGSYIYVAWTEESHGIYFRYSPDDGTTWNPSLNAPAMRLSARGGTTKAPLAAASGSDVYVVWSQSVNKILQIFFAASTNFGVSFSPAIQLVSCSVNCITPAIAAAGPNVYVTYATAGKSTTLYESYVVSSNNYGAAGSWSLPFNYGSAHEDEVAAEGNYAFAVADGVQFVMTSNAGASWTKVINNSHEGDEPMIAVSGPNVYIVSQTKGTSSVVYGQFSHDYGLPGTFSSRIDLSTGIPDAWLPMISATGNYVYLTIHQLSSPITMWAIVSSNDGNTFSSPIDLSGSSHLDGFATGIAASGSYAFTIWPDRLSVTNWDVFASVTSDNGASWTSQPGLDISNNPGVSGPNVDLATSSSAANGNLGFAAWQDNTTGNYQILFAVITA